MSVKTCKHIESKQIKASYYSKQQQNTQNIKDAILFKSIFFNRNLKLDKVVN